MSGHNKWSKVKHKKAVTDAKKSAEFSKFSKLIAVESKKAEGDTSSPDLRMVIDRAKKANMPSENIERAIKKGVGGEENSEEVNYEAYGPGGIAMIIQTLTDNKNRTISEIKNILKVHGASIAEPGAATWAFSKEEGEWKPHTTIPVDEDKKEKNEELEEKIRELDDVQEVYTNASEEN